MEPRWSTTALCTKVLYEDLIKYALNKEEWSIAYTKIDYKDKIPKSSININASELVMNSFFILQTSDQKEGFVK